MLYNDLGKAVIGKVAWCSLPKATINIGGQKTASLGQYMKMNCLIIIRKLIWEYFVLAVRLALT